MAFSSLSSLEDTLPSFSARSSFTSQASSDLLLHSRPPSPAESLTTVYSQGHCSDDGEIMDMYQRRERSPPPMRGPPRDSYDDYRGRRSPGRFPHGLAMPRQTLSLPAVYALTSMQATAPADRHLATALARQCRLTDISPAAITLPVAVTTADAPHHGRTLIDMSRVKTHQSRRLRSSTLYQIR